MFLKQFLAYAMFATCVLSVVIGGLLWFRRPVGQHANRLLALLLFVYAYIYLITVLITDGGIVYVPHLFRTAAPLSYLVGPLIYLYVRAALLSAIRPNYQLYFWLSLPAVFNFIELIPFYAQSAAYKLDRLQQIAAVPNSLFTITEGFATPQFHLIGGSVSSLLYSLLAGRLWWKYTKHEGQNRHSNPVFANWLRTFVFIHIAVNLIWVIEIPFIRDVPYGNFALNITYTVAQLTICLYIIQRPALLYGTYILPVTQSLTVPLADSGPIESPEIWVLIDESTKELPSSKVTTPPSESERDVEEKLGQLELYMIREQAYLQPRLSLADVSVATQVSPYLLSSLLNRVRGLEFRDYVNEHRVKYICHLLESEQFTHLTLEGVSSKAGFSSKTTFYRAFRKHTGATPAQYVARRNQTSPS